MSVTHQHWIERRVKRFVHFMRGKPNAVRVLAEGDSWFTHGAWMWGGKSLIGQLNEYQTVNIVTLAQPGALLEHMTEPRNEQWKLANNPAWLSGHTYDAVLLSGGGNDVVGDELEGLLHNKTPSRQGADLVNKAALERTFQAMKVHLASIRATVDRELGSVPILMHGYDYAQPSGDAFEMLGGLITVGPWIKSTLVQKGIVDIAEQRAVVNHLIDEFNGMLDGLQSDINQFIHVDLRDTLGPNDWDDELHPTVHGRKELAKKYRAAIVAAVP